MIRRRVARLIFRLAGWTMVGEVPRSGGFLGAPHTSNWDYIITLLVMWHGGVQPRILVKKEFFHGPLAWLLGLAVWGIKLGVFIAGLSAIQATLGRTPPHRLPDLIGVAALLALLATIMVLASAGLA